MTERQQEKAVPDEAPPTPVPPSAAPEASATAESPTAQAIPGPTVVLAAPVAGEAQAEPVAPETPVPEDATAATTTPVVPAAVQASPVEPAAEPLAEPAAEPSAESVAPQPPADPPTSEPLVGGVAPFVVPEAPLLPPTFPPDAPTSTPLTPAKKDRRVLRAVLRWTAAVVVFAVAGAGTAYGITQMKRTDVPGLATASDGRWDYPVLTKPPLPSGSPGPFADENKSGAHYADLRALVLPAPKGASADKALSGTDGWLATKSFLAEYSSGSDRDELAQKLTDDGLRHIAARGWTTQDGTQTRIYLLQFGSVAIVDDLFSKLVGYSSPTYPVRGADSYEQDEDFPDAAKLADVSVSPYAEAKPYGAEQIRQAYLSAGDTVAVIVQSRKGEAKAVPFQQTVTLQSQLLD